MAYADPQPHSHTRIAGVTGVALVHVVLAFGLASGLTVRYFTVEPEPPLVGTEIELPPPPTPDDPPPPEQQQPERIEPAYTPPVAPQPPIDIPRAIQFPVTVDLPPVRDVVRVPREVVQPGPVATVTPAPTFTPRGPVPMNGPTGWITTDEYPGRALQRELEGTARYALDVGANGEVANCRVTTSTGHRLLDDATCRWVSRRAEFDPAIDSTGAKVAGTYNGTVTWQIPD